MHGCQNTFTCNLICKPQHEKSYHLPCMPNRLKSACHCASAQSESTQSDQSLCCLHEKILHPWLSKMCSVKILSKLHDCAGWSESLLSTHVAAYIKLILMSYVHSYTEHGDINGWTKLLKVVFPLQVIPGYKYLNILRVIHLVQSYIGHEDIYVGGTKLLKLVFPLQSYRIIPLQGSEKNNKLITNCKMAPCPTAILITQNLVHF